jgi:AcrR family transcriptional regulator
MSPRSARALRGRGGEDPAAALRDLLIDTAERLLTERPAGTLTTREIARAAGVSDGVLYNYFSDKNELIVTALVRRYVRLIQRFDADLPEAGTSTVEENLLVFGRRAVQLHLDGLPIAISLLPAHDLLHRFIDQVHREPEGPQIFAHRMIDYLTAEQELGRVPKGDLEGITTLFVGAVLVLALTSLMGARPGEPAEQVPAAVHALLYGLMHQDEPER